MMSPLGTFETCRQTLGMSVYGGRPEVVGGRPKTTRLTRNGHHRFIRAIKSAAGLSLL
jgi:hypothetical protein